MPTVPLGNEVVVTESGVVVFAAEMEIETVSDFLPVTVFMSCNCTVPGAAMLALSTGELTVLSFTRLVFRALPFQRTTVESLTCEPTTSRVVSLDPASIVCGMTWLMTGTPAVAMPTPPQPTIKKQNAIARPAPTLVNIFKMHPWPVTTLVEIRRIHLPLKQLKCFC